ncbi:hypothetical protein ACT6QH_03990 [Xanthobacter sp. TB0139]|uniref:hypothetical protein n=1 Tax=Xanthobacter sp. TB0139 TaxID=3459178 RepID=UPI0040398E2B
MIRRTGCLCAGLLLFLAILLSSPVRAEDVVDLYEELKLAQPIAVPSYELPQAAEGLPEALAVNVLHDAGHDFLRITRQRGGGWEDVIELALWLDDEGAPLLGLSERQVEKGVPVLGRLRFYSKASGRWNLVTPQTVPDASVSLCKLPPPAKDQLPEDAPFRPMGFLLPQQGADLQVWCLHDAPAAGRGVWLRWNGAQADFSFGPALIGSPPWRKVGATQP